MAEEKKVRVLIIGSGPAGYTAGIYASRANLNPLIYEGNQPGGQLTQTTEIENFPGYPEGIQGPEMMEQIRQQALRFGAVIESKTIAEVDFSKRPFRCVDEDGETIYADTVIVSTGASAKYLGLPDEDKYRGMGVSACATCDGFFYRKKNVAVVGGGDTACEEALYLSTLAKKVYLIVRKNYLRASEVMQKRVRERENIEILFNCNTIGLFGQDGVEGAKLVEGKGTENEQVFDIDIDGFFLAIGHHPNTDIFKGQLDMDAEGYIITKAPTTHTNVEGVFAAGDCADPIYRQAVSAAGTGCRAALDAERFLMEH
ncbi:MAG: thioredoxin-disulfide reductase [Bacteroides sp.]|nr:thioredoxin-disulfide reductase [Bacteroidales bacterium]MBD5291830.1 thioredoxin-disulfide reductase [Bacteroides sp.]MBD5337556.1 thioredoxin-disulfide reductase [Bacteroides sp.]MBD5339877.1 thioredoxin-disulfide reductase [Bacteroides sp.]MDE7508485.1 thioredoxin-disulfide reductase [Muribaculaceae bacterium]